MNEAIKKAQVVPTLIGLLFDSDCRLTDELSRPGKFGCGGT